MRPEIVFVLGGVLRSAFAAGPLTVSPDTQTRMASALAAPNDQAFERSFLGLSEIEQNEIIRILTTDLKTWPAVANIPTMSSIGLREWLLEPLSIGHGLNHLRFVGLMHEPYEIKLRFEKGACAWHPPEPDPIERVWQKILSWIPVRLRSPASLNKGMPVETPNCDRDLSVALSADPGNGTGLKETVLLKIDASRFANKLEGSEGEVFRKKIWENMEILLSALSGDSATLAQRLRVVEVAGALSQSTFQARKKSAILLRARTILPKTR